MGLLVLLLDLGLLKVSLLLVVLLVWVCGSVVGGVASVGVLVVLSAWCVVASKFGVLKKNIYIKKNYFKMVMILLMLNVKC